MSLSDVARRSGFAVPTVSLALRNLGTFPKETREKIQEAARELGYYPNPLLASLASKHFGSERTGGTPLAYIHIPEANPEEEFTLKHMERTAQEYARRLGYRLDIFNASDFKDGAQATRVLFSRGVQGIVLPYHFQVGRWPDMDWGRFAVVGWGERMAESAGRTAPLLYRATVDYFGLVLRAWDEVWKRGYRRIGFALLKLEGGSMDDQQRLGGVQACQQRLSARARISTFISKFSVMENSDSRGLGKWIRRHRPDAVIGFNGWFSWAIRNEGFRIPEEIGFASLSKETDEVLLRTEVDLSSGMKHVKMKSVLAALELLDQQIRQHHYGLDPKARTLMIHSEWIEGDTLPIKV